MVESCKGWISHFHRNVGPVHLMEWTFSYLLMGHEVAWLKRWWKDFGEWIQSVLTITCLRNYFSHTTSKFNLNLSVRLPIPFPNPLYLCSMCRKYLTFKFKSHSLVYSSTLSQTRLWHPLSKAALSLWTGLTSTVIKSDIKLILNFSFWRWFGFFFFYFMDRVCSFAFFAGGDWLFFYNVISAEFLIHGDVEDVERFCRGFEFSMCACIYVGVCT